jgi:hypothetical protein
MPKRRWGPMAETLGVFLAIMLYIWRLRLDYPWAWAVLLGLVVGGHIQRREGPGRLGFGWRNFRSAAAALALWVAAASAALLALGALLGTIRPTTAGHAAIATAGYIAWGMVQQYLLNGYFVNRLAESGAGKWTPLAAAALFSLVHLPNWFLMGVTLAGGYVCARFYLRYRSLWALALAHGIIGFVLFLVTPDSVSGHFLVGPRYLLIFYGIYPEQLL